MDYSANIKLKHNEQPAKRDIETGEYTTIRQYTNNIPNGKSRLKYNRFNVMNSELILKLQKYFTMEEIGIISYMAAKAEFNTNSLKPLSNETSLRDLGDYFNIDKNRVNKIFNKLFNFGVYLQIKIHEEEPKDYWVLNPNISWKGRLKDDSLFVTFSNTDLSKLLK